ncbi:zinc finger, CCHC-type containing protein [Tanacetum coccineum]
MAEDASATKFLKQIGSSSVNMVEKDGAKNSNNNKNKRKFKSGDDKFANKKGTMTCWKCNKPGHMKKDCRSRKGKIALEDVVAYGGLIRRCNKSCLQDLRLVSSILNLNYPLFNDFACMITSSHSNSLSKSELWHTRLGHVHYKRMRDMSKMSLIPAFDMTHESCKTCMLTKITRQPFKGVNRESKVLDLIHSDLCDFHANPSLGHNKYVITFIDDASRYCYVYLLHAKHEALDKFKIYKQEVELQRQDLIKVLRTDRGGEYYDPVYFQSTGIIHQTTAPYTPQQNGVAERKNRTLKEMVNSMLSYSGLSEGFYVIEPNDYVSVNSIIESRDAIFDEERFTSIPRPRGMIQPSSSKIAEDEVEGTRDKTLSQREYCFIIEEDPRTLSEAMASRDVAFWKEAIQSEIDSIMHNNTWELTDLPSGCKALGCKWILKRKMKVDGSIDKYKARLVIQGFRQKEGIDFFDTYAPVARITTIRLLLALAAIHDLVIHQMDVKTAFLNGDLDEEIYMKQPEGFVMPGHESKESLVEGYSDASWINNMEVHSSTSGWVFLLGGGAISWASKKQTCITSSTMESEFVALDLWCIGEVVMSAVNGECRDVAVTSERVVEVLLSGVEGGLRIGVGGGGFSPSNSAQSSSISRGVMTSSGNGIVEEVNSRVGGGGGDRRGVR